MQAVVAWVEQVSLELTLFGSSNESKFETRESSRFVNITNSSILNKLRHKLTRTFKLSIRFQNSNRANSSETCSNQTESSKGIFDSISILKSG